MNALSPFTLDVRDILKAGGEPFSEIMQAVASLAPGQGLRLLATFKPVPLFGVLAQQGFTHAEREIGSGDWEVTFTPADSVGAAALDGEQGASSTPAAAWRAASYTDLRGLPPPEPMHRALEGLEALKPGETLQILTDREPTLLQQELARRNHAFVTRHCADGYQTTIRRDGGGDSRP